MQKLLSLFALVMVVGCNSTPTIYTEANIADTTEFFSVVNFINSQIDDVQKTPYFIYKKTANNGKTDSIAITTAQFVNLAAPFLQPDINSRELKKEYIESPFYDQTTKTYTLNYSTRNKTLEVQNEDVIMNEDGETLKRIFIRKFYSYSNDSSAIVQLTWKPNASFQVSRIVQKKDGSENETQTTVVWNSK